MHSHTARDGEQQPAGGAAAMTPDMASDTGLPSALDAEQQRKLYDMGRTLYQQRKFAEATCVFLYLTMQNTLEARNAFALGACLQAQSVKA